jgi:hypothetical protein
MGGDPSCGGGAIEMKAVTFPLSSSYTKSQFRSTLASPYLTSQSSSIFPAPYLHLRSPIPRSPLLRLWRYTSREDELLGGNTAKKR